MVCESGGQQLDPGPAIWFVGVVVISWCPGHVMWFVCVVVIICVLTKVYVLSVVVISWVLTQPYKM